MDKFIIFSSDISKNKLPKKFNYPHYYTPHKIAEIAAKELQLYLTTQNDFNHNFGLCNDNGIGKMFGVLVVKTTENKLGYLCAFSGKLADKNIHKHFVPPVFDILNPNGFYLKSEHEVNEINKLINELENNEEYKAITNQYILLKNKHNKLLNTEKEKVNSRRKLRKLNKKENNQLNINEEFYLKEYGIYLDDKINIFKNKYDKFLSNIDELKELRKNKSSKTQERIFDNYLFSNTNQQHKNLKELFTNSKQNIPAGAGDCCAPKLLQYAFLNHLTPIAMAEFWWGKPLQSSVRKHKYYYPACKGKCKPILNHMLSGISVEKNPLIEKLTKTKEIETIYEDDSILILNKPYELLSVSGSEIKDSVQHRIKKKYPNATGPLLVHRLDMSTSGILVVAKDKDTHKTIQKQFIEKTVRKRYIAILDGEIKYKKGTIDLPLRVDFWDRPKQIVCFKNGKKSVTNYEVIDVTKGKTKIYFYPITGRTHQLRMHASHHLGLNTPILGDDLYGKPTKRLCLHAEKITFTHPVSKKEVSFTAKCPF